MKLVFINVVMVDMIVIMLMSVNVVVSLFYGVIVMLIVNSSGYVMVVEKNLQMMNVFFCSGGDIVCVSFISIVRNSIVIGVGRLNSLCVIRLMRYSVIVVMLVFVMCVMLMWLWIFLFFGVMLLFLLICRWLLLVRCGRCLLSMLSVFDRMIVVRLLSIIGGSIIVNILFCGRCISFEQLIDSGIVFLLMLFVMIGMMMYSSVWCVLRLSVVLIVVLMIVVVIDLVVSGMKIFMKFWISMWWFMFRMLLMMIDVMNRYRKLVDFVNLMVRFSIGFGSMWQYVSVDGMKVVKIVVVLMLCKSGRCLLSLVQVKLKNVRMVIVIEILLGILFVIVKLMISLNRIMQIGSGMMLMWIFISFYQFFGQKCLCVVGLVVVSGFGWDGVWIEVCKMCFLMFGMFVLFCGIVCCLLCNFCVSMMVCWNIFNVLIYKGFVLFVERVFCVSWLRFWNWCGVQVEILVWWWLGCVVVVCCIVGYIVVCDFFCIIVLQIVFLLFFIIG